ncbi:MAG: hypothetical protein U1F57_10005 [bacterium]
MNRSKRDATFTAFEEEISPSLPVSGESFPAARVLRLYDEKFSELRKRREKKAALSEESAALFSLEDYRKHRPLSQHLPIRRGFSTFLFTVWGWVPVWVAL